MVDNVKESVQGTVDSVKETVQGTVDSVKETMSDTVEGVKQTFDLHRQVDQHPYLMVGGAVVVGFVAGRWFNVPKAARAVGRAAERFGPTVGRFAQSAASNLELRRLHGGIDGGFCWRRGGHGGGLVRFTGIDVRPRN